MNKLTIPKDTKISGQYGGDVAPFGSAKLKILELISIALRANIPSIYTKVVESNFLAIILVNKKTENNRIKCKKGTCNQT